MGAEVRQTALAENRVPSTAQMFASSCWVNIADSLLVATLWCCNTFSRNSYLKTGCEELMTVA